MIEFTKQQIVQNYKIKMQILIKVILITLLSSMLVLLFFDYQNTEYQLDLSSKVNCMKLTSDHKAFACNTCFRVSKKQVFQEQIRLKSPNSFMLIGLSDKLNNIMECKQWLQTVDYSTYNTHESIQKGLKIEPFVLKKIYEMQSQHNQILSIDKSTFYSTEGLIQNQIQLKKLNHQNYVLFYQTHDTQNKQIHLFYHNEANKGLGIHIIKIFSIASLIAVLYVFSCSQKGCLRLYRDCLFNFIGVLGIFAWIFIGNLQDYLDLFDIFCKVMFFSIIFDVVFGAGRWLFFGVISLSQIVIVLISMEKTVLQLLLQTLIFFIIVWKVSQQAQSQYFHFQKNSNKKLYYLTVAFVILMASCLDFLFGGQDIGHISQFLQFYLCLLSFLIGTKKMDIDDYNKIFSRRNDNLTIQMTDGSVQKIGQTQMYEQN